MRKPFRLGLAAAALWAWAGLAAAQPPVWTIHDKDSTIVLFGSVHVLPPGVAWEPPALREAVDRADDLWFVIPFDDASQSAVGRLAVQRGMLPDGQTLSQTLSPAGRERLQRVAAKLATSMAGLERLQPWLAEVAISVAAFRQQGGLEEQGVERRLSAEAPAATTRRAFETPEQQIGFFADASLQDQAASLEETRREIEEEPDSYKKLVDAWTAGDIAALDQEALQPMLQSSPRLYQVLISQRNAAWVKTIRARLSGSGRTEMVVGIGHLIGPGGVPALLRAEGVAVDGP